MNRLVKNSDHLPVRIDRVRHEHKTVEIVGEALQDPRLTVARGPVENPGLAGEQRACNAVSRLARKDQILQDYLNMIYFGRGAYGIQAASQAYFGKNVQNLTVSEVHQLFAGYYRRPRDVDEVIRLVGLDEKRRAKVSSLSGGQKRRLDLGVALVGDPDLVFLDEPTTGFDPAARRAAWEMIRSLRSLGKTVLLTTHYLDEAEQLADRVAVLREGRIVRVGAPKELTGGAVETEIRYREGGEEIVVRTDEPTRVSVGCSAQSEVPSTSVRAPNEVPSKYR